MFRDLGIREIEVNPPGWIFGPRRFRVYVCLTCGAEYHMDQHWDKNMDKKPTDCLVCERLND